MARWTMDGSSSSRNGPFGRLLRAHRKRARMTQEELAERAGLSPRAVTALETGERLRPYADTVRRLADALTLDDDERAELAAATRANPWPLLQSLELPLFGRETEQKAIRAHLTGAGPPLLLYAGEPGVGKTRLLQEAEVIGRMLNLPVLRGGCTQPGGQIPYAPLVEALLSHVESRSPALLSRDLQGCDRLVRLVPELSSVVTDPMPRPMAPSEERRLMTVALRRFLENIAGNGSVLVILDDLQWASPDALHMVAELCRTGARIKLVAGYRDTEPSGQDTIETVMADLARSGLVRRIALTPLSDTESTELVAHVLGSPLDGDHSCSPGFVRDVVRRAGGVPYFLLSCAQEPARDGSDPDSRSAVPWNVAQSVRLRARALPPEAQEVLSAAAVIGRPAPYWLVAAVTRQSESLTAAGIDAACGARLLVAREGGAVRFSHDLVREATEMNLGVGERAFLHRRAAEALLRLPGPAAAELAWHLVESGQWEEALPHAQAAGNAAETLYAYAEAEVQYRTAERMARAVGDGARHRSTLLRLARVLTATGRYSEALEVNDQVIDAAEIAGDTETLAHAVAQLAHLHALRLTPEEDMAMLQLTLDGLVERAPSRGLAESYLRFSHIYFVSGRHREQLAAAEQAERLARAIGDEPLAMEASVSRADALSNLGRPLDCRQVLAGALPELERTGNAGVLPFAVSVLAAASLRLGEIRAARVHARRALHLAERTGVRWQIELAAIQLGRAELLTGEWDEARAHFEAVLTGSEADHRTWSHLFAAIHLADLLLSRGDVDAASQLLEDCAATLPEGHHPLSVPLRRAQACRDLLLGDPDAARCRLADLLESHDDAASLTAMPVLALAFLELDDVRGAEVVTRQGLEQAERERNLIALIDLSLVRSAALVRSERWEPARSQLERTLAATRDVTYPFAEAACLTQLGAMQATLGEREAGLERLHVARRTFERLQARPSVVRVDEALARAEQP